MRPLLVLVAASMVSLLGTGCNGIFGCEGGAPIVDTTPVVIHAPVSSAKTLPACEGVPELTGGYAMAITTSAADAANVANGTGAASTDPTPLLRVSVARSVPLGQAIPLNVSGTDDDRGFQTGDTADRTVHLAYVDPSDGADLDETPLAAALVTVTELPAADGGLLQMTLELHYEDGRILSQTFSAENEGMDKCSAY